MRIQDLIDQLERKKKEGYSRIALADIDLNQFSIHIEEIYENDDGELFDNVNDIRGDWGKTLAIKTD